jgi:7-cyano-7-deazaguanine synthase
MDLSGFGHTIKTGLTDRSLHIVDDAFTPARNLLFLVVASSLAYTHGINKIIVGLLSEQTIIFQDQTDAFLRTGELAIEAALGVRMSIVAPLRDYKKAEVVQLAKSLGVVSYYSCHAGTEPPCGVCIACREYEGG